MQQTEGLETQYKTNLNKEDREVLHLLTNRLGKFKAAFPKYFHNRKVMEWECFELTLLGTILIKGLYYIYSLSSKEVSKSNSNGSLDLWTTFAVATKKSSAMAKTAPTASVLEIDAQTRTLMLAMRYHVTFCIACVSQKWNWMLW